VRSRPATCSAPPWRPASSRRSVSAAALGTVAWLYLLAAIALSAFARQLARVRRAAAQAPLIDPAGQPAKPTTPGLRALGEGVRFGWHEPAVRIMLLLLAVLNIAVVGPILVGGAVLAEQRLGGAAALATVFVGFGAGSVLGLAGAGVRAPRRRGLVLVCGIAVIAAGTAGFGIVDGLGAAIATAAVVGAGAAYLGVVLVAWLQELVPAHIRGRVMSLVVLATVAFDPLSYALAGALLPAGVTVMFAACGLLILLTSVAAAAVPAVRGLR
jgi:hypothetical protein